jgi:hypothetical protein
MIYEAYNQPKKLATALLDRAVAFACEYLQLDVDIDIKFENLPISQFGYCDYDEDEMIIIISKRLSKKEILQTLFHEFVHVKQYIDGRLESGSPQKWMGIPVDADYKNRPWEIEAFVLEEKMMKEFLNGGD